MKYVFSQNAWEDYQYWRTADPKTFERLNQLIAQCRKSPFSGLGKPEPLRGNLQGWWSRRLTHEDRLVYRLNGKGEDQALQIAQCRFHY